MEEALADKRSDEDSWIVLRKPAPRTVLLMLGVFFLACLLGYLGGQLLG